MSRSASSSSGLPRDIWAKSARTGEARGESLAHHTATLASILSYLALRAPALTDVAADSRLWHRAFWACWLHDLGKCAGGFQQYLRGQRGQAWQHRHEVLSLAFLHWVAPADSEDFPWIASAIASHHRDARVILEERYDPGLSVEDRDLPGMVNELSDEAILGVAGWLTEMAPRWLGQSLLTRLGVEPTARVPQTLDLDAFRRQAPTAIEDALRAYRDLWRSQRDSGGGGPVARQAILLRGLVVLSDHLASGHADKMVQLDMPSAVQLLIQATKNDQPRPHQDAASSTVGSIVLAAPTGSGKTEAALLWARRQLDDPAQARKLIYLLPYQASLNAMRQRLQSALGIDVALLHGRADQVIYRELSEKSYSSRGAERAARRAVDLARLHHPPVWVATPYQMLRAAYRLPGYETIWASLGKSVIVIDEPHAYEPARLGLILGLLHELVRHWDVRVCAMTATMPSWLRVLLEKALGARSLIVDRELFAQFQRHRLHLVEGELGSDATIEHIVNEVRSGRSVLVVANTVRGAQDVHDSLLRHLGGESLRLLHSRFTGEDRLNKEKEILDRLHAGAAGARQPLAVVSTQVIEVSLDLDFDTIYSEPAPLEALAQRFGRVNRRGNKGIAPVHVLSGPIDGQGIYKPELVKGTIAKLRTADGAILDEAVLSEFLDEIYANGIAEEFTNMVTESWKKFEASCTRTLSAFESDEALDQQFDDLFDGTDVLPLQLLDEFRRRHERSVIEAHALLVPLSERQRRAARERAQWNRDFHLWTIDYAYDSSRGLQIPKQIERPSI